MQKCRSKFSRFGILFYKNLIKNRSISRLSAFSVKKSMFAFSYKHHRRSRPRNYCRKSNAHGNSPEKQCFLHYSPFTGEYNTLGYIHRAAPFLLYCKQKLLFYKEKHTEITPCVFGQS